ncbi:MAG: type II TA system antitoxin MqsA family protein [Chlorobium sp.]
MKSPVTGGEMILKLEKRVMLFRKKEYTVHYHFYLCTESGEQFTSSELDDMNLVQVHNQYRDEHNLPFPEEIQSIRHKYGLSAAKMAEVLGFGANTYRNYEQGEVPSESNARLIQLAQRPEEFKQIIHLSGVLEGKPQKKLIEKIELLIERKKNAAQFTLEEYLLGSKQPDEYTGYTTPNLAKLNAMVHFFAGELKPWKTALNKLLFYADFLHYKMTGFSISGTRYRAIQFGPVPENYNSIYDWIEKNGDILVERKEFSNGGVGEIFMPAPSRTCKAGILAPDEMHSLIKTAERFSTVSTQQIIAISHQEPAWSENVKAQNPMISYLKYGFELKAM